MTALASSLELIMKFKSEIIKVGKISAAEYDQHFKIGLNKYLDNQFDKIYNTKTFLFRDEKVPFYEVFFPVGLLQNNDEAIKTDKITNNIFKKSNYITILGNAGSGKTMLMKHLFIHSYTQLFRIPIIIELRHLPDYQGNVAEYIYKIILDNKVSATEKILERVLQSGMFLFLFDGYDEIYSDHKKVITEQLESFVDLYSNNYFVITSRPGADAESLSRFNNLNVAELDDNAIESFTKQQLSLINDLELAYKIIDVINKPENIDYKTYLRNPLLLSMFILTFRQYPELPRSKNKFYWNVYDTLITKHDSFSKKGGYQHERKTGLQNEEIEKILKWFSYKSLFKGAYSFDKQFFVESLNEIKKVLKFEYWVEDLINDLTVSASLIIIDGLEYKFPHKSFQEYFCASLIKDLDIDNKKNVYTKRFHDYTSNSRGLDNFWNLCYELDKIYFLDFFIVPTLESLINKVKKDNAKDTALAFYKSIGFYPLIIYQITIDEYGDEEANFSYLNFARTVSPINAVLIYLGLYDSSLLLPDHLFNSLNQNILEEIQKPPYSTNIEWKLDENEFGYELIIPNLIKDEHEYIDHMQLIDRALIFIENIEKAIVNFKNEIKTEKTQAVSLLVL